MATTRALSMGGMVAAGALAASLFSAPMASAATPAPVSASVTLASSSTVLADWHGRYRCWRRWGGDWHFVCGRGGHWWGDRDRGARRGDDHDRWDNDRGGDHHNGGHR